MPSFLLRELDPALMEALRLRAEASGRSLQAEIHATLAHSVETSTRREAFAQEAHRLAGATRGRKMDDAAARIRRDRDKDHQWP